MHALAFVQQQGLDPDSFQIQLLVHIARTVVGYIIICAFVVFVIVVAIFGESLKAYATELYETRRFRLPSAHAIWPWVLLTLFAWLLGTLVSYYVAK